jgi:hypothetical protein
MQAITTTYYGPTNHRGSRIIAKCDAGRRTYAWNYALDVPENHHAAAVAFATELDWLADRFRIVSGSIDKGDRYAHVLVSLHHQEA